MPFGANLFVFFRGHHTVTVQVQHLEWHGATTLVVVLALVVAGTGGDTDTKQAAIAAALERVRKKKEQTNHTPRNVDHLTEEQQRLIREADLRRERKHSPDKKTD